jgi:hypothetical protein
VKNFIVEAISELVNNKSGMFYFQGDISIENIVWETDVSFSDDEIEAKIKELEAKAEIQNIQTSLMTLCDKKQDEAQGLILGYKATPLQIERYKDKYERAKAGEFDEATNSIIIQKHEEYIKAIRNLVDLIEYFRSAVDDLIIASELDRAGELIEAGESFGATTKLEDIKALLGV